MGKELKEQNIAKDRLLYMFNRLVEGKVIYKAEEMERHNCSSRSLQRDIDDLRNFFYNQAVETGITQELIYDRKIKGYRLIPPIRNILSNEEVFAVLKILLESRAFTQKELSPILDKLIDCCVPRENKRQVTDLISNERYHYVEPQHKSEFLKKMWDLSGAIKEQRQIEMVYKRNSDGNLVERTIQPVGILFSEFYFYIVGFIVPKDGEVIHYEIENDLCPTIYRIDRIQEYKITDEHFRVPYEKRFEEGEFRKRVQFMYSGKLQKIKFWYKGRSIEAVLDRLPTAKIIEKNEDGYLVSAEVFGTGLDIWLRSHGDAVEVVSRT